MGRAIAGTTVGAFLGVLVAASVLETIPPFNLSERITILVALAAGGLIGAIIGGTGAIAAAIRQGKPPDAEQVDMTGIKYGRPPRNSGSK